MKFNKIYLLLAWILSLFLPKRKIVYFSSFFGQYNDNPKYISEKLHEIYPTIPIYWLKSKRNRESFPGYVKAVDINSFKHYLLMFTALVTIDNQLGMRSIWGVTNPLKRIFFISMNKSLQKQLNIGTWHGTPLKKIGKDSLDNIPNSTICKCLSYTISGCEYTERKLASAFGNDMTIKRIGTPRNDIFFKEINKNKICNKLKIPTDKKILLFAPTFRGDVSLSGPQQIQDIDWFKLNNILKEKFGGEWSIVVRVHPHVLSEIKFDSNSGLINGNIGDDMAEYLSITDILITDYSSSFFDFMLSKRPSFLYTPDISSYSGERGLYININSLPLTQSHNPEQLYQNIEKFNNMTFIKNIEDFLTKEIGNYEDGHASEKIANDIRNFICSSKS